MLRIKWLPFLNHLTRIRTRRVPKIVIITSRGRRELRYPLEAVLVAIATLVMSQLVQGITCQMVALVEV